MPLIFVKLSKKYGRVAYARSFACIARISSAKLRRSAASANGKVSSLRASSSAGKHFFVVVFINGALKNLTFLFAFHRFQLALAGNALTTNEIVPVNIVHYEVGSLHSFATQIFVTRSPIFLVHWEVCRPTDVIEVRLFFTWLLARNLPFLLKL